MCSATTSASGTYNIGGVPAGTWELLAGSGTEMGSEQVTIGSGSQATGNLTTE